MPQLLPHLRTLPGGERIAKEQRTEVLARTGVTGSNNAGAEFRNDTSEMVHIRELDQQVLGEDIAINEAVIVEVSKSPVMAATTNNNVFFTSPLVISAGGGGGSSADTSMHAGKIKKYARGQLTLEPGESLFMNELFTSGNPTVDHLCVINYEF